VTSVYDQALLFARLRTVCSDPPDDLASEFARLVAELGRERASQIWLDRFAGYDEGQT